MLAKVVPIDGAWQRLQSSRAFKKAEAACGIAAVCVVGTAGPQPRSRNDNMGCYPSRLVVTTDKPALAAESYNRGRYMPDVDVCTQYLTMAVIYTATRHHGELMKEWLYAAVKGEPMLNGFRDVEWFQYALLFPDAARALGIEIFDGEERTRRIWARARKGSA